MQRLLEHAPSAARACLTAQLGTIAGRNSCDQAWYPTFDFQINYKPDRLGLKRRATVSLVAVNSLSGLDQLLHGADGLHGWGQPQRADQTLLYVRGFDEATQQYHYQVNERFGATRGQTTVFRQPFQISLQVRLNYNMNQFFGGGRGGFGGGGGGGGGGRAQGAAAGGGGLGAIGGRQANPLAQLLDIKDSLALDSAQVTKLTALSDSLVVKNDKLGAEVRAIVAKAGNNPDQAALFSQLRPKLGEGRRNLEQALRDAQSILTAEQWTKVPENIKNPFARFQGGDGARRQD
jgi:hypothetical protein